MAGIRAAATITGRLGVKIYRGLGEDGRVYYGLWHEEDPPVLQVLGGDIFTALTPTDTCSARRGRTGPIDALARPSVMNAR